MGFLELQPFKHKTIRKKYGKLAPQFYGPFQILEKIGVVAYRLDLSEEACIYLVFHVFCLKPKLGQAVIPIPKLPPVASLEHLSPEPIKI